MRINKKKSIKMSHFLVYSEKSCGYVTCEFPFTRLCQKLSLKAGSKTRCQVALALRLTLLYDRKHRTNFCILIIASFFAAFGPLRLGGPLPPALGGMRSFERDVDPLVSNVDRVSQGVLW